jgi:hypothetical protein
VRLVASAGVVGMAEVVQPNSVASAGKGMSLGSNVMWTYVWVGAASLFLLFCHMALIGRGR